MLDYKHINSLEHLVFNMATDKHRGRHKKYSKGVSKFKI